jgi:hypothetical protein
LIARAFLNGKALINMILSLFNVCDNVGPVLGPIYLYGHLVQCHEPLRHLGWLDAYLLAELPDSLPGSGLGDSVNIRKDLD